ncbi:HEPN domain-containing protein [Pedobacter antarcticus]|uniref:ApeA N-terminal domain 1-containing protein n=1 Tax=Pedobacter antarcticus TaxID=34086 RepID=UPI0029310464|nr:HEPN domain-containing protein [Pedobacter antarcticus]
MIETKEETYHGVWFLPNSQVTVQGHLTITDFVIELQLTDPNSRQFSEKAEGSDIEELKYPVIYGYGNYGEKITLYDCSGFIDSFNARLMLYGDAHYKAFDEQKFKILGVHIPSFDSWISSNSFKKAANKDGFSIEYQKPDKLNIVLNDSLDLSIDFECFEPSTEKRNKIKLHQFALVNFISKDAEGMNLEELLKYLLYFQQLVSFLSRDGANVSAARVYTTVEHYEKNKFLGTMVYGGTPFNKFEYPIQERSRKYIVNRADVNDKLETFFKNWFSFAAQTQHILKLIFLDYFYRGAFDENNFLNLIRVLEIYHIYKFPGKPMPDADFKQKLVNIIAGVPDEYKIEVKEYLAFKNELTLDQRLTKLFSEVVENKIGLDYSYDDEFKRKVKQSRNYYTHYNPNLRGKAAKGNELEELTISCRALINYLILKHLDISEEILKKSFEYYIETSYYSNYFL